MTSKEKKEKLVDFLDSKAFDPILRKSESDYSGDKSKDKFKDVKKSTENEKNRFHEQYNSAEEVKENFLSDLNSHSAKKKNAELQQLGLPILPDLKDDFLQLCDKLEV